MLCKHLKRLFPLLWGIRVKHREMPGIKTIKLSAFHKTNRKRCQETLHPEITCQKLRFYYWQTASLIDGV